MVRWLARFALVTSAFLAFGVTGCSSGGDGTPSCSDAVSHNYAMGCAISVNGNSLSETDAVNGCYMSQGKTSGGSCSCAKEFNAVLSCMNAIGQGQCNACDNQFAALDGCMGSCP